MTPDVRPRVLLSAYQCGPGLGSVSQIGWEWYSRLARRAAVTLVTHVRNREALERAGAPLAGSEVVYVDTEPFAGPLYRLAKRLFPRSEHAVFLVSSLDFFPYSFLARRLLAERVRRGARWDVAHAVTPVTTLAPSGLHTLGAPLVVGPLNSGLPSPKGFPELMKSDSGWLYPLRGLGRVADAILGGTRNATRLLVATAATLASVPPRHRGRCVTMLENGVDLTRFQPAPWPPAPSPSEPLRVLFVGRLVPFKGVGLLLDAIASLPNLPIRLSIVGDGPMADAWKAAAERIGIAARVDFLGNVSLDRVAEEMRKCHLFCLPSVRESGGAVLLEAMASARPVAAVAFGGPAEIVDDAVGRAIPPDGPEAVTKGFAEVLRDVFAHPEAWRARGEEGRRRAEARFSWDAKIDAAMALYAEVVAESASKRGALPTRSLSGVEARVS